MKQRKIICELWDTPAEEMTLGRQGRKYVHCMKFQRVFDSYEEMEAYAAEHGYMVRYWWYKNAGID